MKERADKLLHELGLTSSRSRATDLIEKGLVYSDGSRVKKSSQKISRVGIVIKDHDDFASRGAEKIQGAINSFSIDLEDKIIADIGASTGGFSDFVLREGAKFVYAIDVGKDQLIDRLKNDVRVKNLEGMNVKYPINIDEKVDLAVMDLSFISIKLVLKNVIEVLCEDGEVVALVKPQFEVGKEALGKNGIVKDTDLIEKALSSIYDHCQEINLGLLGCCKSPILGKTGNREYFFYLKKNGKHQIDVEKLKEII